MTYEDELYIKPFSDQFNSLLWVGFSDQAHVLVRMASVAKLATYITSPCET